jgi:hypothetical protein
VERVFKSLKTSVGDVNLKHEKLDIGSYSMGYYNYQRPHYFNIGLLSDVAEKTLVIWLKLVDYSSLAGEAIWAWDTSSKGWHN